ncbi:hypothetical protein OOK60_15715 [Trichothermofontia sichuanensis B231]|uniref:hypothetical protein n=1 Tax=Trichothermofontia sichuanensis TaxID=3045816 RepID=UPI002245584A|nr:hypothetical protein [Trichothermofontia sichuanensis]UZQ53918.1 hypothetical protein OOK60_15715 [Trichothermofontia sichuanensis B231]
MRDVDFAGDTARAGGKALSIWAIWNCFVITIVRQRAFRTIPPGVRALSNQLQLVYALLTQGFSPSKCNHPALPERERGGG